MRQLIYPDSLLSSYKGAFRTLIVHHDREVAESGTTSVEGGGYILLCEKAVI